MSEAKKLLDTIQAGWNAKDWDTLETCHSADWIDHTAPTGMNNLAALQGLFGLFTKSFPNLEMDISQTIECGENVAYLYSVTGLHEGDFMGIPATGKTININGMTMLKMKDGKCSEAWGIMDQLTMMKQLGVIPE